MQINIAADDAVAHTGQKPCVTIKWARFLTTLSIHPIVYQGKKFFIKLHSPYNEEEKFFAEIYSYREKKSFFGGHKGKFLFRIYMKEPSYFIDGVHNYIDNVRIHLPVFMGEIFSLYEEKKAEMEKHCEEMKKAEAWDGKV